MMTKAITTPVSVDRNSESGKCFLNDDNGKWIADVHSRQIDELAQAVNEREALLAVAEAAQSMQEYFDNGTPVRAGSLVQLDLTQALANLAAVRKGKE